MDAAFTGNLPHKAYWASVQKSGRLSRKYEFEKPNDTRALELMNASAVAVMKELSDISMAYGVSDEYRLEVRTPLQGTRAYVGYGSFVFSKSTQLFERRER